MTQLRSETLRNRFLSQTALTGISAFALALCFAHPAYAATEVYTDLNDVTSTAPSDLTDGEDISGDVIVDNIVSGSTYSQVLSGSGALVINGTNSLVPSVNALTLTGASTYTGTTTILNNGRLILGNTGTIANSTQVLVNQGSVLEITNAHSINNLSDGAGDSSHAAGGGSVVLGGTLTNVMSGGGSFSGVMSGAGGFTTSGAFTMALTGNNTYTGNTTVGAGGTLSIDDSNTLATATDVHLNTSTLQFAGALTLSSDVVLDGAGTLANGANNVTVSGNITGANALTQTGAGTLTLSGTNAFTTLSVAGTVSVAADANLGSGAVTLNNATLGVTGTTTIDNGIVSNAGGTITASSAVNATFSGILSGNGFTTNSSGGGAVILTGNNTFTTLNVATGIVSIAQDSDLGTGAVTLNGTELDLTGADTINNNVALNGGGTIDTNANNDTFSGVISGAGGLTKAGSGLLTLSGVNTYTDGTNINAGGISIGAANNLGGGTVAMATGTEFDMTGAFTVTNAFTLTGTDTIDTNANNDTLSGNIGGTGLLTKTGAGILTLSGTNGFSGGMNVSVGTVSVAADSALGTGTITLNNTELDLTGATTIDELIALNGGGTVDTNANNDTISSVISGTGPLNKSGSGILTLSGTNTYTGGTNINVGTVSIAAGTNLGAGTVAMAAGTEFDMTGATTVSNAFTLTGTDTIDTNANNDTLSGAIGGTGLLSKTGSGILTLSGTNNFSGGMNVVAGTVSAASDANLGTGTIDLAATTELDLTGATTIDELINLSGAATIDTNANNDTISSVISGVGLTKAGSGILTLSGNNTFTTLNVAAGTVSIAEDADLGTGAVTLNATELDLTGATTVNNNIVSNGGGTIDTNANNDTFSGILSGDGFTKTGSGILTLTGVNTFTALNVSVGTVSIGADNNLGSGAVTLNATELDLTGAFTVDNNVALSSGGTVDTNANNDTFSGVVSGTGPLTKTGSGTLTLSGTNTYNGGTNINVGGLTIGAANNLGLGTVAMANNTTFTTSAGIVVGNAFALTGTDTVAIGANNTQLSGDISGTGVLNKTGSGVLTLSGDNSYSGGTNVTAGTVSVGVDENLGTGTVAMSNATGVTFTGSDEFTQAFTLAGTTALATGANDDELSGLVSGAGGITKSGTGTLTLSNDNTYDGATNVDAGTLIVNGDQSAANGLTTIASGAALMGSGTLGGSLVNDGTVAPGNSPGVLTVAGDFSGSGDVDIELTGSNTTAGIGFDQIAVGGTATLTGMDLVLDPIGAAPASKYTRGKTYTILTSDTRAGTFDNFDDGDVVDADSTGDKQDTADNIAGSSNDNLAFEVNYEGDDVVVKIVRAELFGDLGETPNQVAVGDALDTLQLTATGDMDTLLNELSADSDIAGALNTLTGELNADLQKGTVDAMHAFNGMLGKRLGGDCNTADYLVNPGSPVSGQSAKLGSTGSAAFNSAFACGYGQIGKVRGDNNTGDVESTLAGGAFGVEAHNMGPSVVRLGVGYAHNSMEVNSDNATVQSVQAGVYAQQDLTAVRQGKLYVGGSFSGGYNFADTERHVSVGALNRTATGDMTGFNLSGGALVGALIQVETLNIEPVAGVEYIYNNQDSYTELGAGAANLSVSSKTTHSLRASIGGQVNTVLPIESGMTIVPQAHGAFIYDALDVNPDINQSIGGAGFTVKGTDPGRMGFQGGAGLTVNVRQGLSVFGDYNGTFKKDETDHAIMGGVKVSW